MISSLSFFRIWVAIGILFFSVEVTALESVTLQLKWTHAFQFAGYYAAKEKGYYRDAGLNVTIREATPDIDPVTAVISKKAEYGVGTSALILERSKHQPLVVLAVIFQHSPFVFITAQKNGTDNIQSLAGKKVMIEPLADELIAYLKREQISQKQIIQISHTLNPSDLINGRVDAMSAYVTNELYYLNKAHFPYNVYSPRSVGIDFYGDNLFTTEEEIQNHPKRVKAFREASLKGWKYAMEHPEEIADLILREYSQNHPRDFYLFEAKQMVPLLQPDLVEMGYMSSGRWTHIAETYSELGMLPKNFSLTGFLYNPDPHPDTTWIVRSLILALFTIALIGMIALYVHRHNRQLKKAIHALEETQRELKEYQDKLLYLAQHDPLTSLPNRNLFSDRLDQTLAFAKRNNSRFALIYIDLDCFKPVNDSYGHDVGDILLQEVAKRIRSSIRESDTAARIGGDEFVVLLSSIHNSEDVRNVSTKIYEALKKSFSIQGHSITISSCAGIAIFPEHGNNSIEIMKHADSAMYHAKENGRDRIEIYSSSVETSKNS